MLKKLILLGLTTTLVSACGFKKSNNNDDDDDGGIRGDWVFVFPSDARYQNGCKVELALGGSSYLYQKTCSSNQENSLLGEQSSGRYMFRTRSGDRRDNQGQIQFQVDFDSCNNSRGFETYRVVDLQPGRKLVIDFFDEVLTFVPARRIEDFREIPPAGMQIRPTCL